ncbi:MAG: hypothetical protein ACK2T5_14770 [Anaerolineales bacterium]
MLNKFSHAFHIPGTLAANLNIRFTVPSDCCLVHVSAVASNDSDATITLGTSADTDGFLAACVIGDSATPVEKERADFDGALLTDAGKENPRLSDGDIFVIVLDYDGSAGTAADDVTIVLTFTEG